MSREELELKLDKAPDHDKIITKMTRFAKEEKEAKSIRYTETGKWKEEEKAK